MGNMVEKEEIIVQRLNEIVRNYLKKHAENDVNVEDVEFIELCHFIDCYNDPKTRKNNVFTMLDAKEKSKLPGIYAFIDENGEIVYVDYSLKPDGLRTQIRVHFRDNTPPSLLYKFKDDEAVRKLIIHSKILICPLNMLPKEIYYVTNHLIGELRPVLNYRVVIKGYRRVLPE